MADNTFTFSCAGHRYQVKRMNAVVQLAVLSKIAPLFAAGVGEIIPLFIAMKESGSKKLFDQPISSLTHLAPVMREFAKMSQEDQLFIIGACLSGAERLVIQGQKEQWAPVWAGQGKAMFEDLNSDLFSLLMPVWFILMENYSGFFGAALSALSG
jgi:hypothetical protein